MSDNFDRDCDGPDWAAKSLTEQPAPIANASTAIIDLVLADVRDPLVAADLRARAEVGRERYGVYLQAHNGRDALRDAYEKALDLVMYLRQTQQEEARDYEKWAIGSDVIEALRLASRLRARIAAREGCR